MPKTRIPVGALAGVALLALALGAAAGAAGEPDLSLSLALEGGGSTRLVGDDVRLQATVANSGDAPTDAFVVDLWCSLPAWGRHSLAFPGLPPGGNASQTLTAPFSAQWNGLVLFFGHADPAGAVDERDIEDNSDTLQVRFVSFHTLDVGARLASSTPLEEGDILVFRIELRDGESILFEADTQVGSRKIDQYLLDEENWGNYQEALRNGSAAVTYFSDFSTIDTNHISFSTSPMAGGRYYLVLDNAEVLQHGARPAGEATITYSIARVGSGLPVELVLLVAAVGAGAVVATLRWRPSFESTEAVLSVPAPPEGEVGPDDEVDGATEPDDGGPPPGDPAAGLLPERPPRPPRN